LRRRGGREMSNKHLILTEKMIDDFEREALQTVDGYGSGRITFGIQRFATLLRRRLLHYPNTELIICECGHVKEVHLNTDETYGYICKICSCLEFRIHKHKWEYQIRNSDDNIVGKRCKLCGKEKPYEKE
jgi:hypothetical protein